MKMLYRGSGLMAPLLLLALLSTPVLAADGGHRNAPQKRAPAFPAHYPTVGREVRSLPQGHVKVRVGRTDYRYNRGVFYRPRPDGAYVVVRPPLGARVHTLPPGYISFAIGPSRYFYFDTTYYLWDEPHKEYVVVEEPEGADTALVSASSTSGELFIYPSQGQSDEQLERDRYECYLWASDQTGFDPSADNPQTENASNYRRALSACMAGRGYTVK